MAATNSAMEFSKEAVELAAKRLYAYIKVRLQARAGKQASVGIPGIAGSDAGSQDDLEVTRQRLEARQLQNVDRS